MDTTNFYKDFSFDAEQFKTLFSIYQQIVDSMLSYVEQIKGNTMIASTETYRIYPFQRFDISSATYQLNLILEHPAVIAKLQLLTYTIQERMDMWVNEDLTISQKIDALTLTGKYLELSAKRTFPQEKDHKIIDFELKNNLGVGLLINEDYAFENNKLFLLGTSAAYSSDPKYFNFINIAVDNDIPELHLGQRVHIPYNDNLEKTEYNEMMQMLMYAALGGPTIMNLKEAIRIISGFAYADVYDAYALDAIKQAKWDGWKMTPFDFIVVFPEEYSANMDKLAIMIDYLKLIKPAYTKFYIIFSAIYSDLYNRLQKCNDAYNLDIIYDWQNEENVYKDIINNRTNGPSRLVTNFHTFGAGIIEELVLSLLIENVEEEIYNNSDDSYFSDSISTTESEIYVNPGTEETIDNYIDIVDDNYTGVADETQSDSVQDLLNEDDFLATMDDEPSQTTVIDARPDSLTNGADRLNTNLYTYIANRTIAVYNY